MEKSELARALIHFWLFDDMHKMFDTFGQEDYITKRQNLSIFEVNLKMYMMFLVR